MRLGILLERLSLQLEGNILFHFRLFIRKIHFTSLSFYVMFIYDYAIFYGCFFEYREWKEKTIRHNIYFEGVVNENVRDLF